MKEENYTMVATTMMGLEGVLEKELRELGGKQIRQLNRAVEFVGDLGFMYKANLNLRTAIRILKPIFEFKSRNEKELYREIYKYNWEQHFNLNDTFAVHASGNSRIFKHSKYTALKTKDAIVDAFRDKHGKRPDVDVENPNVQINVHVSEHRFVISLDSSGSSLHKRGYKVQSVDAPINEVLASGLILLSDWNQIYNFHDPMCGSGTILVEAAMIANNIPANIFRKKFSFEGWKDFNLDLWEKIRNISLEKEISFNGVITGSDNSQKSLRSCRANINNALMRDQIKVKNENFFESQVNIHTHVIFNPPYGERIRIGKDEFYQEIGNTLKHNYQGCSVWLISSDIDNVKMIGLKPSKKIKVFNGKLECRFLKFDIYEGSKKKSKNI